MTLSGENRVVESIFKHLEYLEEVCELTVREWGEYQSEEEYIQKVKRKKEKILSLQNRNDYEKLLLLDNQKLIGFISIFPHDGEGYPELTPWYATMYVKKEYRGNGYSKLLNDAILKEAKKRGFSKIYLKTTLENYYEKWGAIYLENMPNGEQLYYFDLEKETF